MAKTIFFVDDDKMIINLLEYTFNKNEYNIRSFKTGEDCIAAIANEIPDLVVLDHIYDNSKSVLSGLDTLKEIKSINDSISVVILTSQEDKNLIPIFLNAGASKYINKDAFFIDSLSETFQTLLQ